MSTTTPWIRQLANVKVDPNEAGLISAWDMKVVDGEVADLVAGNDGTVVGSLHGEYDALGRSLRYNGASELNIGNDSSLSVASGSVSFSFWCRFSDVAASQTLISKGSTASNQNYFVRVNAGQLDFYFRDVGNTTNVTFRTTDTPIVVGRAYHIVLVHTFGSGSLTKFFVNGVDRPGTWVNGTGDELPLTTAFSGYLGSRAGNLYLNGNIASAKFFNVHQDQAWVTQEYALGKSGLWKTAYGLEVSAAPTTGGPLGNSPFRVESGSYQLSTYSAEGVSAIALECVSAGVVSMLAGHYHNNNIDSAFGDYECWIEKAAGHTTKLGFVNQARDNVANGYGLQITTDGATTIEEWGVGSVVTGGSLTPGQLTKLNMTRRAFDGQFEGFIDGTSFGTGIDLTVVSSYYTVLELGVGDKIVLADSQGGHAFLKRLAT